MPQPTVLDQNFGHGSATQVQVVRMASRRPANSPDPILITPGGLTLEVFRKSLVPKDGG